MTMPAQKGFFLRWLKSIFHTVLFVLVFYFFFLFPHAGYSHVIAQTPTTTPIPTLALAPGTNPQWAFDSEVTEVGKNAERSRQFLFWVLSHPGIHSAPVLVKIWGISRNIVYVFVVFVIVAFGLGLILSRRAGSIGPLFSGISSPFLSVNIPSILGKIGMILLYVTFSYIIVLGFIQVSEISMRFIKSMAGEELFNVIFSPGGNLEENYTSFIGFKDNNPLSAEMVKTSLSLVRMTSFTYNVMAILLLVRIMILWFLLILSPFLALLIPFTFIRNTGMIWIGVFFQWLLYGPMILLFLVALTTIWNSGIPFPFNFSRVNCSGPGMPVPCTQNGQIYRTAINILYGGPAQVLSAGNSANYVDTYAEYVISLVMLWTAIILPWLLLRIFRDYCCELIAQGNTKLTALIDRMRQFPTPPPAGPNLPGSGAGMSAELPFRHKMTQNVQDVVHTTEYARIEEIKDITHTSTNEITQKMNMSVSSLRDVSRLEINQVQRSHIEEQMRKIASPEQIGSPAERERYSTIHSELEKRALSGDHQAQVILAAGENKTSQLVQQALGIDSTMTTKSSDHIDSSVLSTVNTSSIARETGVTHQTVQEIVQLLPTLGGNVNVSTLSQMSQKVGISQSKVQEVIQHIQASSVSTLPAVSVNHSTISAKDLAQTVLIEEGKISEVLQLLTHAGIVNTSIIQNIAQKTQVPFEKIIEIVKQAKIPAALSISNIASSVQLPDAKVKEVIDVISATGVMDQQAVRMVAQKTNLPQEKILAIMKTAHVPLIQRGNQTVTVEDYEEVKSMWLTHYRNAPIPLSESIRDRNQWLKEEEKKLTNVSGLLQSVDPKLRQQGLERVADILPFMLLGNFSQTEISAYIKAKLEADKQIQQEMIMAQKVKSETIQAVSEEQDTLLTVEPVKAETNTKQTSAEIPKE